MKDKKLFYTGVGSRSTPSYVLLRIEKIAAYYYSKGWWLRSGGAEGADNAFEVGHYYHTNKEIYLPYNGFNGRTEDECNIITISAECFDIAASIHPNWKACSDFAKKAHARNVHQVLGRDLSTPSEFLLCWTQDAKLVGGTRTAIVLATQNNIPVFNLASNSDLSEFKKYTIEKVMTNN
jgi:hypothetical protein